MFFPINQFMKSERMKLCHKIIPYVFVALVIFIPQGICALKTVPYSSYDEIGVLKVLAYVTGNRILGEVETLYYGWGSYIWMFPAFLITDNPITRYRALCVFSAFLQTAGSLFVFETCYKYLFKNKRIAYSICVAVVAGYSASLDIILYNEKGLFFINCLVLMLLCKAFAEEAFKKNYIFAAFLAAIYALTIHTRAIILVGALVVIILFYWLFLKTKLLKVWHVITLFCSWIGVRVLIKQVIRTIWAVQSTEGDVANTSIGIGLNNIKYVVTPEFWKTMWVFCFGQVFSINVVVGGAFILTICVCISYLIICRSEWKNITFQRNLFIMLVFGICAVGNIAGVAIQWGAAIYRDGIEVYGTDAVTLKGIHYTRYAFNYALPLCILALSLYLEDKVFKREYELYYLIIQFLCFIYWKNDIYPKVQNSVASITYFKGIMHRKPYTGIPYETLFYIVALTLSVITIVCLLRKKLLYFSFLAGLSIYSYMGNFYCDTNPYQMINSEYQRASYEYFTEQITKEEFASIEKIYSFNVDILKEQYYLDKVKIVSGLPGQDEAEAIIMYYGNLNSDETIKKEISIDDYKIYTLEEKCYLLVKGEKYLSLFE